MPRVPADAFTYPRFRIGVGAVRMTLGGVFGLLMPLASVAGMAGCDRAPAKTEASLEAAGPAAASGRPEIAPSSPALQLAAAEARRCDFADCAAGTAVVTAAQAEGPFLGCPTEALADYTNTVTGLVAAQKALGVTPNIDPDTGEPAYDGESRELLSSLRAKASVKTFDQAVTQCQDGPYRQRASVINFKKDRQSTWIAMAKSGRSYWVPTAELSKAAGNGR